VGEQLQTSVLDDEKKISVRAKTSEKAFPSSKIFLISVYGKEKKFNEKGKKGNVGFKSQGLRKVMYQRGGSYHTSATYEKT